MFFPGGVEGNDALGVQSITALDRSIHVCGDRSDLVFVISGKGQRVFEAKTILACFRHFEGRIDILLTAFILSRKDLVSDVVSLFIFYCPGIEHLR